MKHTYSIFNKIKSYIILACVLFCITTIFSSLIQLWLQGKYFDSNIHILLRACLCFLSMGLIVLLKFVKLNNKALQELVHYILSLSIVLSFIFCLSFFFEVTGEHPYLVFALNYTAVYLVITVCIYFKEKKKNC